MEGALAPQAVAEDMFVTALADSTNQLVFPWHGFDAVANDWGFPGRVLNDHLLYLITDGSVVGDIGGEPIHLGPGTLLWTQPYVRHDFRLGPDPGRLTTYFVRFRLGSPGDEFYLGERKYQQWEGAWDLRPWIDELVDELGTQLLHRTHRLRGLLLAGCVAALRHGYVDASSPSASSGRILSRDQRRLIEGHVRAQMPAGCTPSELAALLGLSADYFTRLFTSTFGVPPRVWLVEARLDRAARALTETVRHISDIAADVGYDDASAFSHRFKQRYGVSPRRYRTEHLR